MGKVERASESTRMSQDGQGVKEKAENTFNNGRNKREEGETGWDNLREARREGEVLRKSRVSKRLRFDWCSMT